VGGDTNAGPGGIGGKFSGGNGDQGGIGLQVKSGISAMLGLVSSWAVYGSNANAQGFQPGHGARFTGAGTGYGILGEGGAGSSGGGAGVVGFGGPGAIGGDFSGDPSNVNAAAGAHGVRGSGNALGVGGVFGGGRAPLSLGKGGAAGPPATGAHVSGDVWVDSNSVIWMCTVSGTPGTFTPLQPGGINNALYTAVSTAQKTLVNSDGNTWYPMDATNLVLSLTPAFNCQAILTGNADLWTFTAGFNQDIGIAISGGAYPTAAGLPEAWKESGGSAGTFSPNAAFLQTVVPLNVGVAYTIKLVWKANQGGASTIAYGAGPMPRGSTTFSQTRLTAQLVATKANGLTPVQPVTPYTRPALPPALLEKPRP
jgi:hypothetical protein